MTTQSKATHEDECGSCSCGDLHGLDWLLAGPKPRLQHVAGSFAYSGTAGDRILAHSSAVGPSGGTASPMVHASRRAGSSRSSKKKAAARRRANLDPTRTSGIVLQWDRELVRRFRQLSKLIWESVSINDCFGLGKPAPLIPGVTVHQALPAGAFAFKINVDKVTGFQSWLQEEIDKGILGVETGPALKTAGPMWQDAYVTSAYKAGMGRAAVELKKHGITPSGYGQLPSFSPVDAAFSMPIHMERVALLYHRAFSELKGITDAMSQTISRSLSESLAEGRSPRQTARILMNRIEPVGDLGIVDSQGRAIPALRRARMLARTETIRAHHMGNVGMMRAADIQGVKIKAEWKTAGYNVCDVCAELEGKEYTLDEVEPMLPRHPNCRCVALPVVQGFQTPKHGAAGDKAAKRVFPTARIPKKIVRKAKKVVAAPAAVPAKEAVEDMPFPKDLSELTNVRSLGGSTGAQLVKDSRGGLWVRKAGASADHVREELAADNFYRTVGANVPEGRIYETSKGPIKLTRYIEGKDFNKWSKGASNAEIQKMLDEQLYPQFHVDALLGNRDVVGMDMDNLLVDKAGKLWRIDNGGSMRFRAQGVLKDDWIDQPLDFWTMREVGAGGTLFGKMDGERAARYIMDFRTGGGDVSISKAIADLPEHLRARMQARWEEMKYISNKILDMTEDTYSVQYSDRLVRSMTEMRRDGLLEYLPKDLSRGSSASVALEADGDKAYNFGRLRASRQVASSSALAQGDSIDDLELKMLDVVKNINYHIAQGSKGVNKGKVSIAEAAVKKLTKTDPATKHVTDAWKDIKKVIEAMEKATSDKLPPPIPKWSIPDGIKVLLKQLYTPGVKKEVAKKAVQYDSAVAWLDDWMTQRGAKLSGPSEWMDSWGGSSNGTRARAYRLLITKMKRNPDFSKYYWGSSKRTIEEAFEAFARDYGGEEVLEKSCMYWHAYVQEILRNADFDFNDRNLRAVRLLRTEVRSAISNLPKKITSDMMLGPDMLTRKTAESSSIFKFVNVHGEIPTAQVVPHHRVHTVYFTSRSPTGTGGCLAGDGENEFVFDPELIPVKVLSSRSNASTSIGEKMRDAKNWDLPLDHLPAVKRGAL